MNTGTKRPEAFQSQLSRMEKKIDALLYGGQNEPAITARFQRQRDGQFIGRMTINGHALNCWLVCDQSWQTLKDPAFLRLTFKAPEQR